MAEEEPLIGRALGDFIVREQIGAGGFGKVYRAEQPLLGREAVVKVSASVSSPEYVARFLREARLASKLDHPYAAHIYAFGSEGDGTLWTAMELVRGAPLDRLIDEQGPLRLERFVPLFDKLCEVVHTAHEQGIIHRDLKPSNVMVLLRAGRLLPKLLDLGIAKGDDTPIASTEATEPGDDRPPPATLDLSASMRHTRAGRHLGSPAYMAPEQWVDARKADARTDVYAMGILAYEVLTGKLPFVAQTIMGIARLHAKAVVPPLGRDLPPAMDAVIAKATAKKSAERYATALELGAAMRQAAGLEHDAVQLPAIDPFLREELIANAPQPLAEAVAALDGVRNAHQAQGAIFGVVRVIVRMLGNLALVCRCQRPGAEDAPEVTLALHTLRKHGLTEAEWIALASAITKAASSNRHAFPIPELVGMFHPEGDASAVVSDLEALIAARSWFEQHLSANEAAMLERLGQTIACLERLLRSVSWLSAYAVVETRGDDWGERWMGVRRPQRASCAVHGGSSDRSTSKLVVVDHDNVPILDLTPLFQIAPPVPGQPPELFVLDGANRDGARMVSLPTGFERTDDRLWGWLAEKVELDDPNAAGIDVDDTAPYRGLATFTRDDAGRFVGREHETEVFVNRLRVTPMLVVVGASGAGKSSFVQAGVMSALGPTWSTLIVRPGTSPISTLVAALRASELGVGDLSGLSIDGEELANTLRAWAKRENRSLLVYIDQFEELFTLCHDAVERERYVSALIRLSRIADDPIRVVMTVRDDFLLRCQQIEVLRERLVHGLQLLATPTAADLQRILVEPARRAGYEFEDPDLPKQMVDAVAEMAAALPLLSFTAAQMWDLRDRHNHRLSRKAYETLGGVGGALAQHAERVFGQMSADEQRLVRVAFRNLVTADGTRAVLTRAEIVEVLGSQATAESVLEKLITARLLTASEGVGGDRVEVVHEALLSAWPRLIDWRREDAEGARLRDQLRAAARQWEERGRPRGLLWRDEALTEYQLWRARHGGGLMAIEQEFGDASARVALRGRRLRNAAIATIVGILVVGMSVALVLYRDAESQRVKAKSNEELAIANEGRAKSNEERASSLVTAGYVALGQRAAISGDAHHALVYLAAARRQGATGPTVDVPIAESRRGLMAEKAVYRGHAGKARGLVVLRDGKVFATSGADRVVNIWSIDDPTRPRFQRKDAAVAVNTLVGSHDGRWLVGASIDGHVRLYEVATGRLVHTWKLDDGNIFTAAFTPDDRHVISYTENQEVGVWDVATGKVVRRWKATGKPAGYGDVSADGKFLAITSYDKNTRVWDVVTGKLVHTLGMHDDTVWDAAFSPDGALLATASWDKTSKLWDLKTGKLIATLVGHTGSLDMVVWSRDGSLVASGGFDGTVRVWDRKGQLKSTLACGGGINDIDWAHDDRRVFATCGNATVVFDVSVGLPLFRKQAVGTRADRVRPLPNGELISVEDDGTARRWSARSNVAFAAKAHEGSITRLDRCADDMVLTMSEDRSAKLWARGELAWQTPSKTYEDATCSETTRLVFAVAGGKLWRFDGLVATKPVEVKLDQKLPPKPIIGLSPDGTRIAVVDEEHKAYLIDTATGRVRSDGTAGAFKRTLEPKVFWARDGSVFVLMSDAGAVVWDGTSGARRFEVPPPGALVRRITIDVASDSLFVSAMAPDVLRFSLRDGKLKTRYVNAGFAWNMLVLGGRLYVGFDNGLVVEYEVESGKLVGTVGSFGPDVLSIADAGNGLLWVAAGPALSLVDRATRALLFRADLPTDPFFLSARGLDTTIAGLSGQLAFAHVEIEPVDLDQLDLEVKCRATSVLRDGKLDPHELELDACATLRTRNR